MRRNQSVLYGFRPDGESNSRTEELCRWNGLSGQWMKRRESGKIGGHSVLVQYLTSLSERLFTPAEVEKLKRSPKKREYTDRMLDLMVHEQVVSPTEARMLKRMV